MAKKRKITRNERKFWDGYGRMLEAVNKVARHFLPDERLEFLMESERQLNSAGIYLAQQWDQHPDRVEIELEAVHMLSEAAMEVYEKKLQRVSELSASRKKLKSEQQK